MGIRYYAYPVAADSIEDAKRTPYAHLGGDPLMDAWGPLEDKPRMLYLDKCWRELQVLLGETRPARSLVEGQVVMHAEGWDGHTSVLDPAEVSIIADDLAQVTDDQVSAMIVQNRDAYRHRDVDIDAEVKYVLSYLHDAQHFTRALAEDGFGLVYLIG